MEQQLVGRQSTVGIPLTWVAPFFESRTESVRKELEAAGKRVVNVLMG